MLEVEAMMTISWLPLFCFTSFAIGHMLGDWLAIRRSRAQLAEADRRHARDEACIRALQGMRDLLTKGAA